MIPNSFGSAFSSLLCLLIFVLPTHAQYIPYNQGNAKPETPLGGNIHNSANEKIFDLLVDQLGWDRYYPIRFTRQVLPWSSLVTEAFDFGTNSNYRVQPIESNERQAFRLAFDLGSVLLTTANSRLTNVLGPAGTLYDLRETLRNMQQADAAQVHENETELLAFHGVLSTAISPKIAFSSDHDYFSGSFIGRSADGSLSTSGSWIFRGGVQSDHLEEVSHYNFTNLVTPADHTINGYGIVDRKSDQEHEVL